MIWAPENVGEERKMIGWEVVRLTGMNRRKAMTRCGAVGKVVQGSGKSARNGKPVDCAIGRGGVARNPGNYLVTPMLNDGNGGAQMASQKWCFASRRCRLVKSLHDFQIPLKARIGSVGHGFPFAADFVEVQFSSVGGQNILDVE